MSLHRPEQRRQVVLQIYDNEPLARMSEQRLRQEGIPCRVQSLQGGPGLWGSAYNLPHALYVNESDLMRARDILGLPPAEITEREGESPDRSGASRKTAGGMWVILLVVVVVSLLVVLQTVLSGGLRWPP